LNEEQPFISVIVPVHNAENFLAEALKSIINQNYIPMEIIVVDDGSTDRTADVAESFGNRIRYIYKENGGPPTARNLGLHLAQGELIAFLDADDFWSDKKIVLQLKRLINNPQAEIVLGQTQQIRHLESSHDSQFTPLVSPQFSLSLGSAMIRKSAFDKVGIFDESLFYCDDWDWFFRAREAGILFIIHRDVTQYYRKHTQNITLQYRLGLEYKLKLFKKIIDRKRTDRSGSSRTLKNWSDFFET
jgi:glycosyltransferase involved in cell wall biosynthesis